MLVQSDSRVLVCGGREFDRQDYVERSLDAIHETTPISVVINGGARGADTLGALWASKRGIKVRTYPANWGKHGRSAGPIRNKQMLDEGKPTLVVAFEGGRGTAHMVGLAKAANVTVLEL